MYYENDYLFNAILSAYYKFSLLIILNIQQTGNSKILSIFIKCYIT